MHAMGGTPRLFFWESSSHSLAVNSARESTHEKDKGGIHSHPRGVGDNVA